MADDTPKSRWKSKIDAARNRRDTLKTDWQENVSYRVGKPFKEDEDTDRVAVNSDWSRTKSKTAQLFFQVPEVKLRARRPEFMPVAATFAAALNHTMQYDAKAHIAMDETLGDAINAAGIGVVMIGIDATFETVEVPVAAPPVMPDTGMAQPDMGMAQPPAPVDPMAPPPPGVGMPDPSMGMPPAPPMMQPVQRTVYQCYYDRRISPGQFLWPADFTGSDWQTAEWLGYDGRIPLAEAIRRGWVDETYTSECADKVETTVNDTEDIDEKDTQGKYVKYAEIFYRKNVIDSMEKDPRKIGHLVMVDGKDAPVIDEDFKWQEYNPQSRQWIGLTTFPIKVLTLTSISDQAIPPSDSQIGRPQVKELNRSRTQMIKQRDRSLPLRWADSNMVDPEILERLEKGVVQDIIPTNGPGSNVIGEVARANYPRENFEFMSIIKNDQDESWQMGPNQMGFATPGDTSATEASIAQGAASVRLEYERARVLRFFLEQAEGIGSLMQMFQDDEQFVEVVGDDGVKSMQAWDRHAIRGEFIFEAKPDSAVRVDIGQKRVEGLNLYKLIRRDPLVKADALVAEIIQMHGYDPSKMMSPPPPPEPEPAGIRYSFTGPDFTDPLVVALVQKNSKTPIEPPDIQAAIALMQAAGIPAMPPQMQQLPQPGQDGQPMSPEQVAAETAKQMGGAISPGDTSPNPNPQPKVFTNHPGPPKVVEPLDQRYGGENKGADE